ncbi:efflux RND transporter periplasmic adaptor subunit [Chitinivorax sp. B]|uniref:efflux RND transporter periplasmic adaptor subunit n=1 Tax=Chitinivorax sp. B TaxID=2502235 RepID=UPI0010F8B8A0|nr:efflux RND transporter periplasmic adaptor subunit [Chitinivorax sp. B]
MRQHYPRIATLAPLAALILAACGKPAENGMHGMPPPEVNTYKVQTQDLPVSFEYVGETAGSKEVEIRGRVNGILEQRAYEEGSMVKAGQTLFVIDPKPYEAQSAAAEADVASAEARLAQAKREVARLKPLIEQKATSQKEYDDALSNEQLAAASLKATQARLKEARLNLGYTRVTAPVSGITGKAAKSEGSLVSATGDSLLTTVVQVDPLYVNFGIAEDDHLKLSREAAVGKIKLPEGGKYQVSLRLSDGSAFEQTGKLNFTDARVNNQTGTIDARAELANPGAKLKSGQFVRVMLSGAVRPNAVAVPQGAVLESGQGKFVYVIGKGKDGASVAEIRNVQVGEWVNLDKGAKGWIVRDGLKAGEMVILDNLVKVRPGAPVKLATPGQVPASKPQA